MHGGGREEWIGHQDRHGCGIGGDRGGSAHASAYHPRGETREERNGEQQAFAALEEEFETDLQAWKLTGQPALSKRWHISGQRSLLLTAPGQAAEYVLAEALEAGRFQVCFHDTSAQQGAGCLIDMEFQTSSGVRTLRLKPVRVTRSRPYRKHPAWGRLERAPYGEVLEAVRAALGRAG